MRSIDFELADLRVFSATAEHGGITHAAKQLHCVQSAVTRRIKLLESRLGRPLFLRDGRRIVLTPYGRDFLIHARQILELAHEASMASRDDRPRGLLKLGSLESAAATHVPPLLAAFHRRCPDVTVQLITNTARGLCDGLDSLQLDCAFTLSPEEPRSLEYVPLFHETVVLITARATPPVRKPADVGDRTLIGFPHGCAYRRLGERWLATGGIRARRILEIGSYHAMLACVAAGVGFAVVPQSLVRSWQHRGTVRTHPLPKRFGHTTVVFAHRGDVRSAAVDVLREITAAAAA